MTSGLQLPRPPGELEELKRIWKRPRGLSFVTVVNNNYIGFFYIVTGFAFFLAGGILALLMRLQLAVPENDLIGAATYNQLFTTHGTVMMFLFAVPIVEAFAVFLLPGMLAARDLPFPRLSAYAFWAYAIGGTVFYCSLFFGKAPDGGWFMYPPLTSMRYSPGDGADFWLLGVGFIEISAIAGAIELVVGILRTRAPGMSLDRMPIYAWAMLVVGIMIIFAFPPVILGSLLLELERAFDWPFFDATRGGDPLLWQHLFWLFGHPEVYIIFLPAAGMVSVMVPALARTRLVGYSWIVVALVGTGFLSFGLWVHHMFATGIPALSLAFFSAASMAVAIPSGIQVFAWIATFAAGRPRLNTPTLFLLGFLFIFVLGGLTGVMVAMVPFDWQVHDSYFVVAHFHYVLVGGMVFPLFAGFYYWMPTFTGRMLSERLGKLVFWLMFAGFNLAFFPMHISGLMGMPRRIYTYPAQLGWDGPNLLSTVGAFVFAAGVLLFVLDFARHFFGPEAERNPWQAGTLEWLPQGLYAARSIPLVTDREPLWANPDLPREVEEGAHFLPGSATGARETIVTSPVSARPQYIMKMPGPSWLPLVAAAGTAAFFLLLTVKLVWPAVLGGVIGISAILAWLWQTDPGPYHPPVAIGYGHTVPVYMQGPKSHSWWGMVVLLAADGSTFASLLFAHLFLWTVAPPGNWAPPGTTMPDALWPLLALACLVASLAALEGAMAAARRDRHARLQALLPAAALLLAGAVLADGWGLWSAGLRPSDSSFAAVLYAFVAWQGLHAGVAAVMALYGLARSWAGLVHARRLVTVENVALFWRYSVTQGLIGLFMVHAVTPWLMP